MIVHCAWFVQGAVLIKLSWFQHRCSDGGSHVVEEAGVLGVHTGPDRGLYPNIGPILPSTRQKERVRHGSRQKREMTLFSAVGNDDMTALSTNDVCVQPVFLPSQRLYVLFRNVFCHFYIVHQTSLPHSHMLQSFIRFPLLLRRLQPVHAVFLAKVT